MPGLNLFKKNPDKPRLSMRERFRNAAARMLPRCTKSRAGGATDTSRRALMAGSVASVAMASMPAAAATGGDAVLFDAVPKFKAAMERSEALNRQMQPLFEAAKASLPPHPAVVAGVDFQTISEEERMAYEEIRGQQYQDAFDAHGVTAVQNEQDQLFEAVIDPLGETIRNTVPTTLEGVALKAAFLLEHGGLSILTAKDPDRLEVGDQALRMFIEQLALLATSSTATASTH